MCAGARGLEINGKFIKFTAIRVYLEHNTFSSLDVKGKGKSAEELTDSVEFFKDILQVYFSGSPGYILNL